MVKQSLFLSKEQIPLGVEVNISGDSRRIVKLIEGNIEYVSFYYTDSGEEFNPPENARFSPSEQINLEDALDDTTYILLRRGLKRAIKMHGKLLDDDFKSKSFGKSIYPAKKLKLAQVKGVFHSSYEFS